MVIFYFGFLSNPSISTCIASGRGRTGAAVGPGCTPFFFQKKLTATTTQTNGTQYI
jgi:hypothetical protein